MGKEPIAGIPKIAAPASKCNRTATFSRACCSINLAPDAVSDAVLRSLWCTNSYNLNWHLAARSLKRCAAFQTKRRNFARSRPFARPHSRKAERGNFPRIFYRIDVLTANAGTPREEVPLARLLLFCLAAAERAKTSLLPMRWMIGIDTAPGHEGPLHLYAWLQQRAHTAAKPRPSEVETSKGDADELLAAHIVPTWPLLNPLLGLTQDSLEVQARATVTHHLKHSDIDPASAQIVLRIDNTVDTSLMELADQHQADMVVVGRRARSDDARLVRLGRTARHVLRECKHPVVVVPPDYVAPTHATPIVLATDLEDHSIPAAKLALELAQRYQLPLHVIHAAHAEHWNVAYIPQGSVDLMVQEAESTGLEHATKWVQNLNIHNAHIECRVGDPTTQVAVYADKVDACMIVCGGPEAAGSVGLFSYRVGSEIAATANTATLIVPASRS